MYILPATFHYWLMTELMFYVFFHITRNRMEKINPQVHLTSKQRRSVFMNSLLTVDRLDQWLPGWFIKKQTSLPPLLNEIYTGNIKEWLSWAFFNSPLEDVLQNENFQDMEWMVQQFQNRFKYTFQKGYNENIQSRRKNLDPLTAYHRPLVFYIGIQLATIFYGMILQFGYKMKKYGPEAVQTELLWNFVESRVPSSFYDQDNGDDGRICYWFRDGNRDKKPIIFIHGIGAGLMCYAPFLHQLFQLDNPVILIELPFVAMRCVEDVPTMHEISYDIQQLLSRHGFQNAVFVAHSLGSAVTSYCLQHIPKSVASVVLLDPICFMLHYPDVCTNFVYRNPKTVSESIVKYFASTELYIAFFISRHFHWFQLALYVTPKLRHSNSHLQSKHLVTTSMPSKTKVYLSEMDNIVNSSRVNQYLTKNRIDNEVMDGLDHASFLFYPSWQKKIISTIQDFTQ
ncbi:Alpha/Beta hydrolase protein [Cunninghamella echinulata]|nr:Alpha/Beta hydrolase protein [Cunninghamella echinulata]